jgi:hypothetical protein
MRTLRSFRSVTRAALVVCALVVLTACPAEMWIPIETAPRPAVSSQHVQYLEEMPTKPFHVIGIITPPEGEYETEAEMVKAMRAEAAKHGADAIFIESQTEKEGWHFNAGRFGASGGSATSTKARAKAIVFD